MSCYKTFLSIIIVLDNSTGVQFASVAGGTDLHGRVVLPCPDLVLMFAVTTWARMNSNDQSGRNPKVITSFAVVKVSPDMILFPFSGSFLWPVPEQGHSLIVFEDLDNRTTSWALTPPALGQTQLFLLKIHSCKFYTVAGWPLTSRLCWGTPHLLLLGSGRWAGLCRKAAWNGFRH